VTVVTMLVCSLYFACEAAGASRARHSLRPLFSGGEGCLHNSGASRGEIAKLWLDAVCCLKCEGVPTPTAVIIRESG
jgi:hypothetical protein